MTPELPACCVLVAPLPAPNWPTNADESDNAVLDVERGVDRTAQIALHDQGSALGHIGLEVASQYWRLAAVPNWTIAALELTTSVWVLVPMLPVPP